MDEIKFKLKPVEGKPKRSGTKEGNTGNMWIVFDTSKQDIETVMRDYQALAMRFLWRGAKKAP